MSRIPTLGKRPRFDALRTTAQLFFSQDGALSSADRIALAETAMNQGRGAPAPEPGVVSGLRGFAQKVARWAYKVTDEDVAALREVGHSEDAVWEAIVAAGMGISMDRLDRALQLIDAADEEQES